MIEYVNISNIVITSPQGFLAHINVLLNSPRILDQIKEEKIELREHISPKTIRVDIIGRINSKIGEILIKRIEKYPGGADLPLLEEQKKIEPPKPLSSIEDPRIKELLPKPERYHVSVYLRRDLPDIFKSTVKSFCETFTDIGRHWDYII